MFFAFLILTSIFNNIQAASFANKTDTFLHDVHKRSPQMCGQWEMLVNSMGGCDNAFVQPEQLQQPFPWDPSINLGQPSNLCAGITVARCGRNHAPEIRQCKVCGLVNSAGLTRGMIFGKVVIPSHRYPWMVALMRNNQKYCGGAIISDSYVLTAAHCISSQSEITGRDVFFSPNEVSLGFLTSTSKVERGPAVERIIPHPAYNSREMRYDIALLKLSQKITCGIFRNPICLPSPDLNIDMKSVLHITGWGTTVGTKPHNYPKQLMESTSRLVNYSQCKARSPFHLEDVAYCLVGRERSRPCFGDSGGSMFYFHKKKMYAMGVASLHTCLVCSEGKPFIYASVPKAVPWIEQIAGPRIKP